MIDDFNSKFTINGTFDTKALIVPHAGMFIVDLLQILPIL